MLLRFPRYIPMTRLGIGGTRRPFFDAFVELSFLTLLRRPTRGQLSRLLKRPLQPPLYLPTMVLQVVAEAVEDARVGNVVAERVEVCPMTLHRLKSLRWLR